MARELQAGLSFAEIGRKYGCSKDCAWRRAVSWGLKSRHPGHHPGKRFVIYQGRRLNLHQLSRETGIGYRCLWRRFDLGLRGDQLLRPERKRGPQPKYYDLGIDEATWREYAQLAREVGLRAAANRTGLPYGALAAAVRGEVEKLG